MMDAEMLPAFLTSLREVALEGLAEIVYEVDGELTDDLMALVLNEALDFHRLPSTWIAERCEGLPGDPRTWQRGEELPASQDDRRVVLKAVHAATIDMLRKRAVAGRSPAAS
jgi:hypothetical protein